MRRDNVLRKNSLLNDILRWRSCSGVPRGYVNRIRLWPLRRDDHSGVLIGAGGERRSDWPARVLTNGVFTRIDRYYSKQNTSLNKDCALSNDLDNSCHKRELYFVKENYEELAIE